MSAIQMSIGYEYPVIELPCAFVDYYMARCKPVHALIYIHSFRQCVSGGTALSSQEISQIFDISEIGVHKALKYWENEG
ncbi:MAG: hypothetical protein LBR83_05400, partial [Clostridiales bacterium]|nr:hypothetical protein [Clostridiales bacterium]